VIGYDYPLQQSFLDFTYPPESHYCEMRLTDLLTQSSCFIIILITSLIGQESIIQ